MKPFLPALSLLALPVAALLAEPTVGPAVQAHGGQNGARNRLLDDIELTTITKAEETFWPQANTLTKARAELVRASLELAPNSPALVAKTKAVADAELAYALSRADAFAKVKVQLKVSSPAKLEALLRAMSDPAGTGNTGGGRAGAPAAGGAPTPGRGN
jgi:hypothetical protein